MSGQVIAAFIAIRLGNSCNMSIKRGSDITIKDIAEHLGLSHPTVSRALRDMPSVQARTRERVKQAALELGYIPNSGARMLRRTRSELIGVIFPDVQNDFYSATMATLAAAFLAHSYKLVLATSEDDPGIELKHVQSLREARVAGVIIAPTANMRKESIDLLSSIPAIQLLRQHPKLHTAAVKVDERAGIALATQRLIEQGHARIALIAGFSSLSTGKAREAGYREAMSQGGIPVDESLIQQGTPRPEFGHAAMSRLLDLPQPPTGVVLASSQLTLGALAAIQERHVRVPEQLALVGYHDPPWFRLWGPGITCVSLPVQDMAATGASLLLRQLSLNDRQPGAAGDDDAQDVSFQPKLVVRGTG